MMANPDSSLAPATVLAEIARLLTAAGYHVDRRTEERLSIPADRALLAEDKYGVVAAVVYDTWGELASSWRTAQGAVAEALSSAFTRLDRKAWDGYLLLLTPGLAVDAEETVHEIRYDTSRVRKLVATGDDLSSLSDVERALLPLLPIVGEEATTEATSPLEQLAEHLAEAGIDREIAQTAIDSFIAHRPIVEQLHEKVNP